LIARTVERNEDWTSGLRLWTSSARAAPDSVKVQRALARIAMESDPSGGRADEAIAIASKGLRIVEQAPLPLQHMPAALYEELGVYYSAKAQRAAEAGRSAEARALFGQVVTLLKQAEDIDREINRRGKERLLARGFDPGSIHDTGTPSIYRNLGSAYLAIGDPARAVETLSYLERIRPASDDAHYTRGVAEGALAEFERARGNPEQAREHMERAAVSLIESILLNPVNEPSWQMLERAYAALAPPPNPVRAIDGKRTLDTDHPLASRHLREACVQLVRQLDEGGVPEEAERWRRRLITEFRIPKEALATPRR
jgi:tetratricopeptide (TPR) repeat protein